MRTRKFAPPAMPHLPDMDGDGSPPPFGEVDLTEHGVRAYLIKMPEFLITEFEAERPEGVPLGRLRIPGPNALAPFPPTEDGEPHSSPAERARLFIDVPAAPVDEVDVPASTNERQRQYDLHFPDEPADIVLFSYKPAGDDPDVRVCGRVKYQCDARPVMTEQYRNINRRRVEDAAQLNRETVHMDESERIAAMNRANRVTAVAESVTSKVARQKKKDASRSHLGDQSNEWREAARTVVFRAFEARLHYTADELARQCDEPLQRLRPTINELCIYNKSGPFNGKYELKDEYKTVAQREQKEQELEDSRIATIQDIKRRREENEQNKRELNGPVVKRTKF
jgi:transcription initiation factor TFIIF subunit beta